MFLAFSLFGISSSRQGKRLKATAEGERESQTGSSFTKLRAVCMLWSPCHLIWGSHQKQKGHVLLISSYLTLLDWQLEDSRSHVRLWFGLFGNLKLDPSKSEIKPLNEFLSRFFSHILHCLHNFLINYSSQKLGNNVSYFLNNQCLIF